MTKAERINMEIANLYNTLAEEIKGHLANLGGSAEFTPEDNIVRLVTGEYGDMPFVLRSATLDGDDVNLTYECGKVDPMFMESEMRVLSLPECVEILKVLESR